MPPTTLNSEEPALSRPTSLNAPNDARCFLIYVDDIKYLDLISS